MILVMRLNYICRGRIRKSFDFTAHMNLKVSGAASFACTVLLLTSTIGVGQASGLEYSLSISTDSMGALGLVETIYKPNTSTVSGNQSNESNTPSPSDAGNMRKNSHAFDIKPSIRFGADHKIHESDQLFIGVNGSIGHLTLRARYPNGFSFQNSGREVSFIEATVFKLINWDISVGPYFEWQLSPYISAGTSLTLSINA
jgi:hypothetical protein